MTSVHTFLMSLHPYMTSVHTFLMSIPSPLYDKCTYFPDVHPFTPIWQVYILSWCPSLHPYMTSVHTFLMSLHPYMTSVHTFLISINSPLYDKCTYFPDVQSIVEGVLEGTHLHFTNQLFLKTAKVTVISVSVDTFGLLCLLILHVHTERNVWHCALQSAHGIRSDQWVMISDLMILVWS